MASFWERLQPRIAHSVQNPFGILGTPVLAPYQQPQSLDTRPPLTGGSDVAARQARELQSILNRQLTESIIPSINREYGVAGRFPGGRREAAIGRAGLGAQQALAGSTAQNLSQIFLTELGLGEERAWRQAQLDAGQPSPWEAGGEILPYLLMMMKMGMI